MVQQEMRNVFNTVKKAKWQKLCLVASIECIVHNQTVQLSYVVFDAYISQIRLR